MIKLQTYLNFDGNTEEAFLFYKSVFGGEFSMVVRFKDMPYENMPEDAGDKIMHISLPIGKDDLLMASDVIESMGTKRIQGDNVYISIGPDSKEEADRIFEQLSAGGIIEMPIEDQEWGDYFGSFQDKFGIWWMVMYSEPETK